MKPVSRWPWILRFPLFCAVLVTVWWGPMVLLFVGLSSLERFTTVTTGDHSVIVFGLIAACVGWNVWVMRRIVNPHIEPFFNIRSLQNPHTERFTPEPVHSFRDFLRWMFWGR